MCPGRSRARALPHIALALLAAPVLACATAAVEPLPAAAAALAPAPVALGLTRFVQMTVVSNLTIESARLQAQAAAQLTDAQRALYDPAVFARLRRDDYERPRTYEERTVSLTNIEKANAVERLGQVAGGLRGKLPTGAVFEVSHDVRRRQSNLLATEQEREHRGTLTLSIRQPLLRDAGRAATEADLQVTELEQQIERQKAIKQLLDTVGEAAGTYWQLYRAQQALALRAAALDKGRALLEDVSRRIRHGFAPRTDLGEAQVMVGSREAELVRARQQLDEARARVRNLLGQSFGDGSAAAFVTKDAPTADVAADVPADPARLDALLQGWPSYQIARLRMEQEDVRWRHARNQALPDLDLELGYNGHSLDQHLRGGIKDTLRNRHPGWWAGVSFEMPLDNRMASSRVQAQRLRRDAAATQLQSEGTMLGNEWVTRLAQLRAARDEVALLQREVTLREGLVAAERMTHERGRARLADLLDSEARLEDGRVRLLDAVVRAQLAQLSVQAVTGELFARFGVEVSEAVQP